MATERVFQQVLANLMSNAAKFSPSGSTVDIWAERQKDKIVLHVRDQGKGIPSAIQPHLSVALSKPIKRCAARAWLGLVYPL